MQQVSAARCPASSIRGPSSRGAVISGPCDRPKGHKRPASSHVVVPAVIVFGTIVSLPRASKASSPSFDGEKDWRRHDPVDSSSADSSASERKRLPWASEPTLCCQLWALVTLSLGG